MYHIILFALVESQIFSNVHIFRVVASVASSSTSPSPSSPRVVVCPTPHTKVGVKPEGLCVQLGGNSAKTGRFSSSRADEIF